MEKEKLKNVVIASLSPVAKLMGHSLASALGFAGLALVSLVPIGVVHLLHAAGLEQLADKLHGLENFLLTLDIILSGTVFSTGVAVFLTEVLVETKRQVFAIFQPEPEGE